MRRKAFDPRVAAHDRSRSVMGGFYDDLITSARCFCPIRGLKAPRTAIGQVSPKSPGRWVPKTQAFMVIGLALTVIVAL